MKKIDYNNLKDYVYENGIEIDFNELKISVAFLDDVKTNKTSIEVVQIDKKSLMNT